MIKNHWNNWLNTGIIASLSEQEHRKIQFLNELNGVAIILTIITISVYIFLQQWLLLTFSLTAMAIFLTTYWLNKNRYYAIARVFFIFSLVLYLTVSSIAVGKTYEFDYTILAIIGLPIFLFDDRKYHFLFALAALLSLGVCEIGYEWIEPVEVTMDIPHISFFTKMFILIGVFFSMSDVKTNILFYQKKSDLLIATIQEKNEELEKTYQQISQQNQELRQFAYVVAHDLKEPLRMISSYTQLLQRRLKHQLNENTTDLMAYVIKGVHRMRQLLTDLLAYATLDREEQRQEKVDLNKIIQDILQNLKVAISESHAVITHPKLPTITANPTQMIQLFQNLLSNSIKFRGTKEPKITISVEEKPQYFLFAIKDNGIGIAPEYQEKIFGVFQRLHTRTQYEGTGIGLAICQKIVHNQGGKIWLESKEGEGTTFFITFPKSI